MVARFQQKLWYFKYVVFSPKLVYFLFILFISLCYFYFLLLNDILRQFCI
jgi:hypothetical protein